MDKEEPSNPSAIPPSSDEIAATLYRISALIGRVTDTHRASHEILQAIAEHLGCDAAILALVDPDTGILRVEHLINYPADLAGADIPSGVGLTGWVALHRTPLLVPDVQHDPRDIPVRPQTRSAIVHPLEIDGHLHGVFSFEKDQPDAFHHHDLEATSTLVAEAAHTLRELWRHRHLQRQASQFEILSNIAQELSSKLEADELLRAVTRHTLRLADCALATIQLHTPATRTLHLSAAHPADAFPATSTSPQSPPWPLEETLAGSAVTTRKQLEFTNLGQPDFADLHDIPRLPALQSVLLTPLIDGDHVIGVLSVFTDHPHRFSNDERRLLRALANIASVALQNARLYQRVFQTEETLRQNERLTTLGLLAAEIAHETRNPLTVIRLLFGALNLEFPPDDPRRNDVEVIREKLDQLESFVSRVLSVAKAPESMHTRVALDDIIRETCQLLRLKLKQAHIHLHYQPSPTPLAVDCNKGQIQQVLLNLLLNAINAMPEGGHISISTSAIHSSDDTTACIDITDTGPGIPEQYRDRIFDSFLSARADHSGTGLGLSISRRIMRNHHGDIQIVATGPKGTTMRISMPAAH